MRLSTYILESMEPILQEWEEFAETLVPAHQKRNKVLLRDHGKQMLEVIAADLAQPQTAHEKSEKAKGHSDMAVDDETAASTHGLDRLALGFSLNAAMAEYRALRASVTRLWQKSLVNKPLPTTAMEDIIRFNEAIDQSINESITSFAFEKEQQMRVFDAILSSSPDLNFTLDLHGKFTYANKALLELVELPLDKILGKNYLDLRLPDAEEFLDQVQQVIANKIQFRGETPYPSSNGQKIFYEYILVPTLDNDGRVEAVAGTARNITERKKEEDKNWQKANYDALTGLPNRRLFLDRLTQEIKQAGRDASQLALLFVDLDRFKEANDGFGHDVGDVLLREVADRMRSHVRETDTVARLGGDEFVIILQHIADIKHVELIAEKIISGLSLPFTICKHQIAISASVGIAIFPQDANRPTELMKNADRAMYTAKATGRNRMCFFSLQH